MPTTTKGLPYPSNSDNVDIPGDMQALAEAVDLELDDYALTTAVASGYIAKALVDAKGDLIVATGADTVARVPVGTNGKILVADSAEASGVKWIDPPTGDITGVAAGTGLTGGGTSGDVTLSVDPAYLATQSINTQTASYTLVLADAGKAVEMNVASANNLTIPPNSSVAYPVGTVITISQVGAGQTTLVAGAGVTLQSNGSKLKITGQYGEVSLRKRATDTWIVSGLLSA